MKFKQIFLALLLTLFVSAAFSQECGRTVYHSAYKYPGYFSEADLGTVCGDVTFFSSNPTPELKVGDEGLAFARANIFDYDAGNLYKDEAIVITVGGYVPFDTVWPGLYYETQGSRKSPAFSGREDSGNRHFAVTIYDVDGNWIATKREGTSINRAYGIPVVKGNFYFFIYEFSPYFNVFEKPKGGKRNPVYKSLRAPVTRIYLYAHNFQ